MNRDIMEGYHDVELTGVEKVDPGGVVLSFAFPQGERRKLQLHECEFLRMSDFVSQNVVSRMMVITGKNISRSFVEDRLAWATSLSDSSSFLAEERMVTIVGQIMAGRRSLLVLEPSWGGGLSLSL
ncbi:hypothetical protein L2Y94_09725 [Luteibacter aegosomatis]|uniref:hypothetical protein n=1 Tax=Luteibacter aegosomatis TaxID=2911537 RepID=UPI001FF77055|nr:hypothetical protein [Luteibacter aegosomatis]UPG87608.1 hypothetical protein L2Y94_09725 [Luteibacter aegosomatis]